MAELQARRVFLATDLILLIAVAFIAHEAWTAWSAMESGVAVFHFSPSLLFALLVATPHVRHPARWARRKFGQDAKMAINLAFFGSFAAILAVSVGLYLWFGSQITRHGYVECPESKSGRKNSSIHAYAKELSLCRGESNEGDRVRSPEFEQGPLIDGAVLSWLDANAGDRLIQMPVEVNVAFLKIESSFLSAGKTRIAIQLEDATSAGLAMNLKGRCSSYPCRVWLEGKWGPLMPRTGAQSSKNSIFSVFRVIGPADRKDVHIRVVSK